MKTVGVFADDDQAIFEFAGAEAENVKRFIAELKAKEYPLSVNYRCAEKIVKLGNLLIKSDPCSSGRQMEPYKAGGRVRYLRFPNPEAEAEAITTEIQALVASGAKPIQFAILVRGGYRVQTIVKELESVGLPVERWYGPGYDSKARKAVEVCLSVARGKLTDRQIRRLSDLIGLKDTGERTTKKLLSIADSGPAIKPLKAINELVWQGARPRELLRHAKDCIAQVKPELVSGIDQIIDSVKVIEAHDPDFALDQLLSELGLGGISGSPTQGNTIKITTVHKAKGLQWPRVYFVGLEEGHLPDHRSDKDPKKMREERRACFVGVCRAEEDLTLSSVDVWGTWTRTRSRFLDQMGF